MPFRTIDPTLFRLSLEQVLFKLLRFSTEIVSERREREGRKTRRPISNRARIVEFGW